MLTENTDIWDTINASLREQAKGVRCYVESEFAPMKACFVGDTTAVYIPDVDSPQYANLFQDNSSPEFLEYLRKNKNRNLRDADPETFDKAVLLGPPDWKDWQTPFYEAVASGGKDISFSPA